jgi:pyruvate dehydrogenase (quinone)
MLGMIRWEQMGFLGNPEFGVEFSPIDWVKFAESCGGKGYAIKEPNEVKSIMNQAMKDHQMCFELLNQFCCQRHRVE